jgi:hypothetical protein
MNNGDYPTGRQAILAPTLLGNGFLRLAALAGRFAETPHDARSREFPRPGLRTTIAYTASPTS